MQHKLPYLFAAIVVFCLWLSGRPRLAEPTIIDRDSLRRDTVLVAVDTTRPRLVLPAPKIISETPIPPPTASFAIEKGRAYSYISLVDSSAIDPRRPQVQPAPPLSGGFPEVQRIICLGTSMIGDSAVFRLSNNARIGNLRARLAPREIAAFQRTMAIAYLDSTSGGIIREISQNSALTYRADTIDGRYADFTATLWDFYGRWMLHLSDDFSYVRDEQPPLAGLIRISLTVEGRDTVDERECFVARLTRGAPDRDGFEKIYWVDVAERVTVQASHESFLLKLIIPSSDSTDTLLEGSRHRQN
jgi:hypothetical protein